MGGTIMKAIQAIFLTTLAAGSVLAVPAFAGGFSASKGTADMARAEQRFSVCLVSAQLAPTKPKPFGLPDDLGALVTAAAAPPWDVSVMGISEDVEVGDIARLALEAGAESFVRSVPAGEFLLDAANAVGAIPSGADSHELPDAYAELWMGNKLMMRTAKVSETLSPVWNHCASFRRTELVGGQASVRVIDYDTIRPDLAELRGAQRQRGDLAGFVQGASITTEVLNGVNAGAGFEERIDLRGEVGLEELVWRIEPVVGAGVP
jgi:hypothetical protein